jgi:hypothetical protein
MYLRKFAALIIDKGYHGEPGKRVGGADELQVGSFSEWCLHATPACHSIYATENKLLT